MRRFFVIAVTAVIATVPVAAACGSRGPLDDDPIPTAVADASTIDVTVDTTLPADASAPDAGPLVNCGLCIGNSCTPSILACVTSTSCTTVFQCVITTCVGGASGLDTSCLLKCGSSDPSGAIQALQVFQCVQGTCGSSCGSLLGGLGGLGGGGAGAGGKQASSSAEILFSPWPQLLHR